MQYLPKHATVVTILKIKLEHGGIYSTQINSTQKFAWMWAGSGNRKHAIHSTGSHILAWELWKKQQHTTLIKRSIKRAKVAMWTKKCLFYMDYILTNQNIVPVKIRRTGHIVSEMANAFHINPDFLFFFFLPMRTTNCIPKISRAFLRQCCILSTYVILYFLLPEKVSWTATALEKWK